MKFIIGGVGGGTSPVCPTSQRLKYGTRTTSFGIIDEANKTALVIDAGNGIQTLYPQILESGMHVEYLGTHGHLDHVGALGLCPLTSRHSSKGGFQKIFWPNIAKTFAETMTPLFDAALWPVMPWKIGSDILDRVVPFEMKTILDTCVGSLASMSLTHGGGACGYRYKSESGLSIAIMTDHELMVPDLYTAYAEFVDGVDILLADVEYSQAEYDGKAPLGPSAVSRKFWGHSTPEQIAGALTGCTHGVGQVLIVHHNQWRTDEHLEVHAETSAEVLKKVCSSVRCAQEGEVLDL